MTWHVYIIECNDGSFYTGITNDLNKRIIAHNAGCASKYTKSRRPVRLCYIEPARDRSQASRREYAIKSLTKSAKQDLIDTQLAEIWYRALEKKFGPAQRILHTLQREKPGEDTLTIQSQPHWIGAPAPADGICHENQLTAMP